ncbi:hypothetical protein BaRGS_00035851, partial [Batillaria attramentaria]
MASCKSDRDERMTYLCSDETKMECSSDSDNTSDTVVGRGGVSVAVLCNLCQRLHHEIQTVSCTASDTTRRFQVEPDSCRNSISWDEFFGALVTRSAIPITVSGHGARLSFLAPIHSFIRPLSEVLPRIAEPLRLPGQSLPVLRVVNMNMNVNAHDTRSCDPGEFQCPCNHHLTEFLSKTRTGFILRRGRSDDRVKLSPYLHDQHWVHRVIGEQAKIRQFGSKSLAWRIQSWLLAEPENLSLLFPRSWLNEDVCSSLELAPSLLSIYDNLAASEACSTDNHQNQQQYDNLNGHHDRGPDPHLTPCGGVTRPCSGFWVTERHSQQRLFVHACARVSFSGRPVSMMEAPRESSVDGEKEAKKRPLSISSLSSVSSTSLQRLQFKRPNLARDAGEESCSSDQTSQTSSDSNLAWAMADQVSLTSTDSGAALQGRCIADAREGDRRGSASSSVDGHGAKNVNANVSSELSKLHVDVKCEGEAGSGKRSPGYGSRTSSSTSLTNSLGVSQTAATPSSPVSPSGTGMSDSSSSPGTLPVTIKPLQTTIRPVVISLPDIIRRHSRSSASGSVGNVGDMDSCGSSVDDSVSGIGEGGSSVDGDSTVGDDGSNSTDTSAAVTPQRSPLLRNSSQNSGVEPFFNLTVRRTTGTSPTTSTPCPNSVSSPALMSLASSKTSSVPPLSLTRGSAPQYPSPLQNVVQQHSSSPLSPTAIARRRFLASHFDIPDVPPLDPPPCVNGHHDPELEQSRARLPSTGDGVPSSPGSKVPVVSSPDAAVPLSPARVSPLADRSPVSPGGSAAPAWPVINGSLAPPPQNCASSSASYVSTPSPSPTKNEGGFNISPSKDTDSAKQIASAGVPPSGSSPGGIAQPRPPSDYDNQRQAAGASAVDTHTSPAGHSSGGGGGGGSATTSPTTRSRSHKRQDGGGVGGGRGGSTKGGPHSYVSYVQRVVTEILDTERMYIDSLEDIIKGYLQPLERLLDTKVGRDDLACLFCNIRDIYTFGKIFLWDLEQCGLDPVKVAECFVRHNTGFVIYTEYCTNYP